MTDQPPTIREQAEPIKRCVSANIIKKFKTQVEFYRYMGTSLSCACDCDGRGCCVCIAASALAEASDRIVNLEAVQAQAEARMLLNSDEQREALVTIERLREERDDAIREATILQAQIDDHYIPRVVSAEGRFDEVTGKQGNQIGQLKQQLTDCEARMKERCAGLRSWRTCEDCGGLMVYDKTDVDAAIRADQPEPNNVR